MRNLFERLKVKILGPTRLAPSTWQVADAVWGSVHEYPLAKLCIQGRFPEAEKRALSALARATRPGTAPGDLGRALLDLACVFQVQGQFDDAVKAREQYRRVVRKAVEDKFPGIAEFCRQMREISRVYQLPWPHPEWHGALRMLAFAEEALVEAYVEERRLQDAVAACDYAIEVRLGIGDAEEAARLRKRRAVLGWLTA